MAAMKPKDQITIGLVTALASIVAMLFYYFRYSFGRHDHILYVIFPLGLIAPTAYAIFLVRRKATPARVTFWVWFAGWLVYLALTILNMAYLHNWLAGRLSPAVETIYYFLTAITAFPAFAFTFSTWQVEPFIRYLIVGTIIMGFLWAGERGIARSKQS
jgi:hypothetical protein